MRNFFSGVVLGAVCIAAAALMGYAAYTDSAIVDELAHIPAGYGYMRYLDYRLNPEHPPLLKSLSAFPLLFLNLNFPINRTPWASDVNGQWATGAQFLYESGNDANTIIRFARLAPIILTIALILFLFRWAKEFLRGWALLPALLFGLSPTVLAHGHYVTTDIAATAGIVGATYYLLKFLREQSKLSLVYAGVAFGIAQTLKFSAVLLIPYFALLFFFYWLLTNIRYSKLYGNVHPLHWVQEALRHLFSYIAIIAVGYVVVVYPLYFLFTLQYPQAKQTADTEFILSSFAGGPTPAGSLCQPMRCLADATIWATHNPLTRPVAQYALGVLMVVQRSSGGNTNYFLGEVSATGSPWYFPVVYLLKEPLPVVVMITIAAVVGLMRILQWLLKRGRTTAALDFAWHHFTEISLGIFIVFYWVYSVRSPLNIGLRHVLPTLPFIYILTASGLRSWLERHPTVHFSIFPSAIVRQLLHRVADVAGKYIFIGLLLIWFITETAFAAPSFLSYFNELGGGTTYGYRYVTDSNYDWGQDLLRLKEYMATHPEIDRLAIDYFGGGSPQYSLGSTAESWWSSKGNPSAGSGQTPPIHYFAVSINSLQQAIQPLHPGQQRKPEDEYRWLTAIRPPEPGLGNVPKPDARIGTTLFLYKL